MTWTIKLKDNYDIYYQLNWTQIFNWRLSNLKQFLSVNKVLRKLLGVPK